MDEGGVADDDGGGWVGDRRWDESVGRMDGGDVIGCVVVFFRTGLREE